MSLINKSKKYIIQGWKGFIIAILGLIIIFLMIAVKNPGYQSSTTIGYVYARETGGNPEQSDFDLAIKYCQNTIALNIQYPDKKDECRYLLNLHQELDVKKEKSHE